jgi:hypothetical protein
VNLDPVVPVASEVSLCCRRGMLKGSVYKLLNLMIDDCREGIEIAPCG